MTVCIQVTNQGDKDTQLKKLLGFNARVIEAWALRPEKAAEKMAAEKAVAAKAAALGLLQPLEALSLDADTLRAATVAAVAFCDAQGASSVADLVACASKLIANPQYVLALGSWVPVAPVALLPPAQLLLSGTSALPTNHTQVQLA